MNWKEGTVVLRSETETLEVEALVQLPWAIHETTGSDVKHRFNLTHVDSGVAISSDGLADTLDDLYALVEQINNTPNAAGWQKGLEGPHVSELKELLSTWTPPSKKKMESVLDRLKAFKPSNNHVVNPPVEGESLEPEQDTKPTFYMHHTTNPDFDNGAFEEKGYEGKLWEMEVEKDADGIPWDNRIHSTPAAMTKLGRWRKKRGVTEEVFDAVMSELENKVEDSAVDKTEDAVENKVEDKTEDAVEDKVEDKTEDAVEDKVEDKEDTTPKPYILCVDCVVMSEDYVLCYNFENMVKPILDAIKETEGVHWRGIPYGGGAALLNDLLESHIIEMPKTMKMGYLYVDSDSAEYKACSTLLKSYAKMILQGIR